MNQDDELLSESRQKNQQTSTLLDFVRSLHSSLDAHAILQIFVEELKKHLAFDSVSYINTSINCHFYRGHPELHSFSYHLSTKEVLLGEILFTRRTPFNQEEIYHLEELLCLLIPAIKNAVTHYHALQTALHDPLTHLLNRGSLDKTLARELKLAKRHQQPFSCMMCDIDNFKSINDNFGHLIGDEVLKSAADIFKSTIRDTDMAFRIGGEEFLILLNNTTPVGADLLAERIRHGIEQTVVTAQGQSIQYTLSIGITHFISADTTKSIISRADKALYQAKTSGKNRICIF